MKTAQTTLAILSSAMLLFCNLNKEINNENKNEYAETVRK